MQLYHKKQQKYYKTLEKTNFQGFYIAYKQLPISRENSKELSLRELRTIENKGFPALHGVAIELRFTFNHYLQTLFFSVQA